MTLTKRVIPCIDVDLDDDGEPAVYTGVNFEELAYTGDPVEMAKRYNEAGADEFVFLDITASAEGRETMLDTVSAVADEVFIPLTVGGGIRDTDDIRETLRAGADKVSINSGAIADPSLVDRGAKAFGSQCIVISVDARRRFDEQGQHYTQVDGESCWFECTVHGGREGTGMDAIEWVQEAQRRGAGELFVNSIDADGTQDGYDVPLTAAVCDAVSTPVIASSGCGAPGDMADAYDAGADAALAASIFHFDEYSIAETKETLADAGYPIRAPDA
ncbi:MULTISPECIES: imidazole glycerol phosphate synthase subunit HisF [Halobacterium]|uniref:Imidazole glycerol phosphate synthase subunit HisF n=5 Tax=Halobacterium salinarum TaxID=2242 RepID=HIS6_HALSA|nr:MULTISPECIES: imidazole glycerol phosphate synthase subunit HisF [Halobacterium]B0R4B2.1 RecName: Full=Imidazole glycerol phosphate synthase subunit HisF; AltName: Full=IGP synthase cyclase subunit; AltName: Full=IGP synthase subunit HisF; AltName: Full=ImGP synthase subunit HisF; Short=IGPS subunit HisF [Halobacterium salinarum R1]Q9HR52.1 RecName: Full=Imidazole glycerol phosphate synthase subunit HisF; AltName: Full=IGP synthase cyclase subunit; AltName: Full=IGP synthase subunit HisF; AltN